jgi:methylated-DNA-[protein]-cysteine S-methyltransferase
MIFRVRLPSPIGELSAFVRGDTLVALEFPEGDAAARPDFVRRFGGEPVYETDDALAIRARFGAYLAGDLRAIDSFEVDPGGTPFQRAVWAALRRIPPGTTCSYTDLARVVGTPTAVRAVGAANGANPVAVIIPCHRVVRSDGSLGGYGGGLERKRWLLEHEKAALPAGALLQRVLFPARPLSRPGAP